MQYDTVTFFFRFENGSTQGFSMSSFSMGTEHNSETPRDTAKRILSNPNVRFLQVRFWDNGKEVAKHRFSRTHGWY